MTKDEIMMKRLKGCLANVDRMEKMILKHNLKVANRKGNEDGQNDHSKCTY